MRARVRRGAAEHPPWRKVGTFETVRTGDTWACAACGTAGGSYAYRYYPPESDSYERCVGFSWCVSCRVYVGNMVFVPRREELVDALAGLPAERRERLRRSEIKLVEYLAAGGVGGSSVR